MDAATAIAGATVAITVTVNVTIANNIKKT